MRDKKIIVLFCSLTVLASCFSSSSANPESAFKYWTRSNQIPNDIKVLHGEYYQSPHFTLEYEVFLKFKPTKQWWYAFKKQNNLVDITATDDGHWSWYTNDKPWFKPNDKFTVYATSDYERNESRYFIDYENGICYVYETLGM